MITGYDVDSVKTVISFLKLRGLSDEAIAGILGNLYAESRVYPNNAQNSYMNKYGLTDDEYVQKVDTGIWRTPDTAVDFCSDRIGFGIYQLTSPGRKTKFWNICKERGCSIADINAQLQCMWEELNGSYKTKVLDVLANNPTVREAAEVFVCKFEVPASVLDPAKKENTIATRAGYAEEFYKTFFENSKVEKPAPVNKRISIMLDAGHDRQRNQSTVYKGYNEATFAWKLQNYLKAELEKAGFEVGITRLTQDTEMDVVTRGKASKGYDVFLSLHSNACGTESVDRPVVIYPVDCAGTDIGKNKELAVILAETIHTTIGTVQPGKVYTKVENYDRNKNGKLGDDEYYGVLHGAQAVGTLYRMIVEHSFHTNYNATKWLYKDDNIKRLAEEEAKTLSDFFNVEYIKVNDDTVSKTLTYTVKKGDTLSKIASKFNTTVEEIMALNKFITNKNVINIGWVLTIPSDVVEVIEDSKVEYVVQKGDTLSKIAKEHGTTVLKLQAKNSILNPSKIYAGQVLMIN